MASEKFRKFTVPQLKEELSRRGAKTQGRKADLIERLEAYERNFDFRAPPIILPTCTLPDWPTSGFKQLDSSHLQDIPDILEEHIKGYFQFRLASDREISGDFKGIEKGKLLLQSGRIDACSFKITPDTNSIYFTGIVGAAMKKKVSYNYKVKINHNTAEIQNSDCECPAGKGPNATCKHIATVLLMLVKFKAEGEILVGKTCTDRLQTFHQPKKSYTGSPKKSVLLHTNKKPKLDDPRPHEYRNRPGYQDHVRNLVINFCSNTNKDLTMRYNYGSADIQTATLDHDYLQLPITEHWVDTSTKVTEEEAIKIEISTRNQASNPQWFKHRSWRITASRFGDVCKATKRRNMDKLCDSITSSISFRSKATSHGKQFETRAIKEFEKKFKLTVKNCGFFICVETSYIGATPDGIVDGDCLIEVKCPYTARNDIIKPGKHFPYLKLDENGNININPLHSYFFQVQGQLHIAKRQLCYFIVYTFKDMLVVNIKYDREYCVKSLIPKLELFWKKYLRKYIAGSIGDKF